MRALLLLLPLAACVTLPGAEPPTRGLPLATDLPAMKAFSTPPPPDPPRQANADIARDFVELSFYMESGRPLDRLTRFEQPVTVAFHAPPGPQLAADLDQLVARLRNEAKIDISVAPPGSPANIVIQTLPGRKLRARVPRAACFVVPRVQDWREFLRARRKGRLDWSTLERRERAAVFIPADIAPQEQRDCLHEEIAQALGPLNDLYRLPQSVFNDDNVQPVLTAWDMLILRAYYDPALQNGMTREQVARALPAILRRINPDGEGRPRDGQQPTPRRWVELIEAALAPRSPPGRRITAARRALAFALARGWRDNRLGFSLFVLGRQALGHDGATAAESFARAHALFLSLYGPDDIHTANVALQLAAFALSAGRPHLALKLVEDSIPPARRAQNAALLATLLMVKAAALDALDRRAEAATVRLDSLGWARYGFASDREIRARLREISALARRPSAEGA